VTVRQVQHAWREAGVSLPGRDLARALRSLTARKVITGSGEYSFAVDLQRRWLDKHRRLDWVKEELAEAVQRRNRSPRLTRRRR
jgi:hypothetical protein